MPKHEFLFNGESVESSVENQGKTFRVKVGERQFEICPLGNNLFTTIVNGRKRTVAAAFNKGIFYLDIDEHIRKHRLSMRRDADDVERRLKADGADFKDFENFDERITDPFFKDLTSLINKIDL